MSIDTFEAERQFAEHLRQHGLVAPRLVADGHIHRCDVAAKNKSGKNDGTYLLHIHSDYAVGGCKNWTAVDHGWEKWVYRRKGWQPSATQQREIEQAIKEARTKYEKELARKRAEARARAENMWKDADDATSHPYARRKRLVPHELRAIQFGDGDWPLLVPMYDEQEELVNLQFIHTDGRKHGLTGGPQSRVHYWVNPPGQDQQPRLVVIADGWATA